MDEMGSIQERHGRGSRLAALLQGLVQASADFEGAVLVSREGLVMAAAWPAGDQDDSDVGAVATRAFELSGRATESLGRGALERLILLGSKGNVIITEAGPHALCVALLKPEAKIGIASFEALRISRQIASVLE
jgi:predicted regulator of Ras-like GTPase activity (Roadblock/LC7/MglB family)